VILATEHESSSAEIAPIVTETPAVPTRVVRSLYHSQDEVLRAIMRLHCKDGFECDITYGNGVFWKNIRRPRLCFDIDPQFSFVEKADSVSLPLAKESVGSVVCDPPFLTYVRSKTGNGKMVHAGRFSGYWRYDELSDHYRHTLSDVYRVMKRNGIMVFKCQDIIHNHKMHCTHVNVVNWAEQEGFRLVDLFILAATHRMPSPNRKGTQKHARIYHCYFLVLAKPTK
jgi:hypothetical protein